jgi:hypothetical protein
MSNTTEKRYSNNTILSPDGKFMCRCDDKRSLWYLKRNLATIVDEDPLVIKLTFEPKGNGHYGELFYEQTLCNRCVICGSEEKLTGHHVVPREFRKHMPSDVKDHSHHDILTMCDKCHFKYERDAAVLKKELSLTYGIPMEGTGKYVDIEMRRLQSTAKTLLRHGSKIPDDRFKMLEQIVIKHYGEDYTEKDLRECSKKSFIIKEGYKSFGEQIIKNIAKPKPCGKPLRFLAVFAPRFAARLNKQRKIREKRKALTAFVRRWRLHFLKTAEPRYLPNYWDVNYKVWRSS